MLLVEPGPAVAGTDQRAAQDDKLQPAPADALEAWTCRTLHLRDLAPGRRPLKPRTFRIAAGQSVSIGGLARIDVVEASCALKWLYLLRAGEAGGRGSSTLAIRQRRPGANGHAGGST